MTRRLLLPVLLALALALALLATRPETSEVLRMKVGSGSSAASLVPGVPRVRGAMESGNGSHGGFSSEDACLRFPRPCGTPPFSPAVASAISEPLASMPALSSSGASHVPDGIQSVPGEVRESAVGWRAYPDQVPGGAPPLPAALQWSPDDLTPFERSGAEPSGVTPIWAADGPGATSSDGGSPETERAMAQATPDRIASPAPSLGDASLVTVEGLIGWADPSYGPLYLATPWPVGSRVLVGGPAGTVTRISTDRGPSPWMQKQGRIADVSARDFAILCGVPLSFGLCPGTLTLVS